MEPLPQLEIKLLGKEMTANLEARAVKVLPLEKLLVEVWRIRKLINLVRTLVVVLASCHMLR